MGTSGIGLGNAIQLECDVSPDAKRSIGMGEVSIEALGGIAFISTVTTDSSISQERLESLVEELSSGKPTLQQWLSTQEGEWVFYVAHNLQQPEVSLAFTPMDRVTVNGTAHFERNFLPPGAHGFHVTQTGASVSVEHVWVPLKANES